MLKKMLSLALLVISFYVHGQENSPKRQILNDQSVVRGEDGMVYPYNAWKKLMASGKYGLKNRQTTTDSGKPEYLIYELSEKQKVSYFESGAKPRSSDVFVVDQTFEGTKITDINGVKYDLRNLKGKVLVLYFWFLGEKMNNTLVPQLNELAKEYKDNKDVILLAICNNDKSEIKAFLNLNPFDFNIVDSGREISKRYSVKLYPTTVVIDQNNQVKFSTVGSAPSAGYWIKKTINESLALK
ncbi:peroxiredoxin family protein [Pedobacter fastidiosus]|uniref:TlpA family protein disulfide reductase n=1 Tax=Pedobacter fastidiosus TaxID=2765361 RepID=A0ABR7KQR1_9SPHI|nr:TlpA disulfide reductase family protein [Pedobacter fastidiosus]MBC6110430.1 TlpA family protein disulfide reductase [Pedobacter fastidiosus]